MDKFYLSQRPFLEDFLDEVSLFFNVHVYTASEKDYADMILSYIDPKHKIQKKLYRNVKYKPFYLEINLIINNLNRTVGKKKKVGPRI